MLALPAGCHSRGMPLGSRPCVGVGGLELFALRPRPSARLVLPARRISHVSLSRLRASRRPDVSATAFCLPHASCSAPAGADCAPTTTPDSRPCVPSLGGGGVQPSSREQWDGWKVPLTQVEGGRESRAGRERSTKDVEVEPPSVTPPSSILSPLESSLSASLVSSSSSSTSLRSVLALLARLVRPEAATLGAAICCLLLAAAAELSLPTLLSECIAAASAGAPGAARLRSGLVSLGAAAAVFGAAAATRAWLFSGLNAALLERLRLRFFDAVLAQPVSWLDAAETGDLGSRLGADCASLSRAVATTANVATRNLLQAGGAALLLARRCPPMALACGAVAALNALSAARFGDVLRASQRAYQDQLGYSNSRAEEGFRLARALRVLGAEAHASAAYERSLRPLSLIYVRQGVVYAAALAANVWFGAAMRVGALLAGAWAAIAHGLAPHELTACMLYVDMLSNAALHAAEQYGPIMEALGAGERVVHYLGLPPAPQLARGVVPGERLRGEIELRNVTFVYESRPLVPALDNVSLSIRAGERVAFVGLSGSGKSTLVALVQRLFDPTSGALLADGHDLRRLDAPWFRAQLGVVPQEPALFAGTVAENVALGNPLGPAASEPAAVAAALRRAHALGFVQALPRGLDATVGERTLSGGQRQRLAIARALLRDPAILVLDEATSALDAESEAEVQRALEEDAADSRRTVLVVAHRLATVRRADRIVVLDKGRVVEQGTHLELLGRGGIYAALVRRQLVMEGAAAELREGEGGEGGRERGEQAASTAPALPGSDCLPGGGSRGGCDACDMDAARGGELGG